MNLGLTWRRGRGIAYPQQHLTRLTSELLHDKLNIRLHRKTEKRGKPRTRQGERGGGRKTSPVSEGDRKSYNLPARR
jgi:hypothetical protein